MVLDSQQVKELALHVGFTKAAIASVQYLPRLSFLQEWLACGYHGEMSYMAANSYKRMDMRCLYPRAKSVIVVADNYYTPHRHSEQYGRGKISRYAWGTDYHRVMKKKLKTLLSHLKALHSSLEGRFFVDTGPVMEKLWAVASGLGWQGKHSNVISRDYGSWLFLGELAIDYPLHCDSPIGDFCGKCTACMDACPTSAIVAPYVVDASRCIAYLTIELRNQSIPEIYREKMNSWIFGCDICQEVCPWNKRFASPLENGPYIHRVNTSEVTLEELSNMDENIFRQRFAQTPVLRAKWHNFSRNVRFVLQHSTDFPL